MNFPSWLAVAVAVFLLAFVIAAYYWDRWRRNGKHRK